MFDSLAFSPLVSEARRFIQRCLAVVYWYLIQHYSQSAVRCVFINKQSSGRIYIYRFSMGCTEKGSDGGCRVSLLVIAALGLACEATGGNQRKICPLLLALLLDLH